MAADDIKIEKVIGTEHPGEYKHPACIAQLDNGDIFITYYGGGGEYEDESKVWGMRRKKGETTWSEPQLLADTPFRGEGNGIVWQAPDGLVWLFYVQRYGETWSESRIKAKVSRDGAHTWSDSMVLSFEMGTMVRGRPIVLNNGEYLLPVYYETGSDRGPVNALAKALSKDLGPYSQVLADLRLVDFKVRITQGGTEAVTRVIIDSEDGQGRRWSTVGVSVNIIDA
ncbi:MAG: exo-alpha-sialidase, partial [Candidatus Hydrogenedentes bacterium]|nr:exo-alpha-sialidase [Candidatus Hydrogenedentota bacterium]